MPPGHSDSLGSCTPTKASPLHDLAHRLIAPSRSHASRDACTQHQHSTGPTARSSSPISPMLCGSPTAEASKQAHPC